MNREMSGLSVACSSGISHSYNARLWLISRGHAMWNACLGILSGSQVEQTLPVIVGYKWDESGSPWLTRTVSDHPVLLLFSLLLETKRWIMSDVNAHARAVRTCWLKDFMVPPADRKSDFSTREGGFMWHLLKAKKTQRNVWTQA